MITISGHASGGPLVGIDWRMEEIAGAGVEYRLTRRIALNAEYVARFVRNPDFSDHDWHPERNVVSEPRIGITYMLRYSRE
jgi:opacity protein-like surface antigen